MIIIFGFTKIIARIQKIDIFKEKRLFFKLSLKFPPLEVHNYVI